MKKLLIFIILILTNFVVNAMNIRSIEIQYEPISNLTFQVNVVCYVYEHGPIDQNISLNWGDGTNSNLNLLSISPAGLPYLKKVIYYGQHTYSGPSTFLLSVSYKCREPYIANIPLSVQKSLYTEALLVINPYVSSRYSLRFQSPAPFRICSSTLQELDMSVYDPEPHSNATYTYQLISCRDSGGVNISNYAMPSATSSFLLDPNTGIITWDTPIRGEYSFVVRAKKLISGVMVGYVDRDVTIIVNDCQSISPVLNSPADTCIIAGNDLSFPVSASFTYNDTMLLTASGQLIDMGATFPQPIKGVHNVSSNFSWDASCNEVSINSYSLNFRVDILNQDNSSSSLYNFNNGILSPFTSNVPIMFNSPCGNGWDNTKYIWYGKDENAPRYLTSPVLDLSDGDYILEFDMRYEEHTGYGGSSCEGPDEPDEGVYVQYNTTDSENNWINIVYFNPNPKYHEEGGHETNLTHWNNYTILLPAAALTPNTRIRWYQDISTNYDYDHWGLDNIGFTRIADIPEVYKKINVSVIAPAPENLQATATPYGIELQWQREFCDNAIGYKIFRKNMHTSYVQGVCETGLPDSLGFTLIDSTNTILDTIYTDYINEGNLAIGNEYCYRVYAYFSDGAESKASNEACAILSEVAPVITHVSVNTTDEVNGEVLLKWSKPNELDTIANPGPYKYDVYFGENLSGDNYTFLSSTFSLNDTVLLHQNIDTKNKNYHYQIRLLNQINGTWQPINSSSAASSVFLVATPSDKKIHLNFNYLVPWTNDSFYVYRFNDISMSYELLAKTNNLEYLDTGLINGNNYCYKVLAYGHYSAPGFVTPLENWSQEICAMPIDIEPPCSPILHVTADCNSLSNILTWQDVITYCDANDLSHYQVFYSPTILDDFTLLVNTNDTSYIHTLASTVAGCYYVVAVDTNNNASQPSMKVCSDINSCDLYSLPNVFTPDGDGYNDLFQPFPYDFVEKIHLLVYNRWGNLVFETQDPDINWDGTNMNSGRPVPDGVYYYLCEVYEWRLEGLTSRLLNGSITIIRH